MTSILKTDEIQSQNGGAVVKMQTLKHPSASGNNLELASNGNVSLGGTLSAGTLGSSILFPTGHIVQSVFSPSITNKDTSASGGSELPIMDVRGQITLSSSSNGVFVFFNASLYTHPNTSSYGKVFIRKGTTDSLGTILIEQKFGAAISGSIDHALTIWGYDASPGSTTPDYVLSIQRNASTTNGINLSDSSNITKCHLFEVKQ